MNYEKFGVDDAGFIRTEVSLAKVDEKFKPIVYDVLNSIEVNWAPQVDGVYLYGSVATGRAVAGSSDLDLILVFRDQPDRRLRGDVQDLADKMSKKYEASLDGVGLEVTSLDDLNSETERFGGLCFLKHLCVCLIGNDVTSGVPPYRPSLAVAKGFNGDIGRSLLAFEAKIDDARTERAVVKLTRSLAKKIVRTGFSLVMPRTGSWTTELQTSRDVFVHFYPAQTDAIDTALAWSKSGCLDKPAVFEYIHTFGHWLTAEFQSVILAHC